MASVASEQPVCCPRCGYDQAGVAATWGRDVCPLEGTCSECGLRFAWGDVLNPDRQRVAGFVEHARGRRGVFAAAWRTLGWTFHPTGFWRRVRLEHACVPRRWLVYVLATVGAAMGAARVVIVGLWLFALQQPLSTPLRQYYASVDILVGNMTQGVMGRLWFSPGASRWQVDPWSAAPPAIFAIGAASVMMPVMLLVLPTTRARLKIRAVHVWRAGVFGALPLWLALMAHQAVVTVRAVEFFNDLRAPWPGRGVGLTPTGAYTAAQLWRSVVFFAGEQQILLAGVGLGWCLWWWGSALRTGFRAPRWGPILAAQFVAALLAAAVVSLAHPGIIHFLR